MVQNRKKHTGGGAATFSGTNYQSQVGAWVSVQILAEQSASLPWDLPALATFEVIKFETDQSVDDMTIQTSFGEQVFIQAKHSLELGKSPNSIFGTVIDQFVRQFLSSPERFQNHEPFEKQPSFRDRLVLVTSSAASSKLRNDIPVLLRSVRNLQKDERIENAASNDNQKDILETLVRHITAFWNKLQHAAPTEVDIRNLLSAIYFYVLDVSEDEAGALSAQNLLRTAILQDQNQANQAWNILIQSCASLSGNRGSTNRISLQRVLLQAGVHLRTVRSFQYDVDRVLKHSHKTLQMLTRQSRILVKNSELRIVRPVTTALRESVENRSILVVGNPGAGKSGALHDIAQILLQEQRDVVLLAVDQLAANSLGDLRNELGIQHDLVEVIDNWQGKKPGFVIIDALDAARSDSTAQFLKDFIYTLLQTPGHERWRIIASIRKYDLRNSLDLQQAFRGKPLTDFIDPEFDTVSHINIPELDAAELEQVSSRASRLRDAILKASPDLLKLIKNPYNLKLLAELVESGLSGQEISPLHTQLDLLDRYWKERVIRNDKKGDARESLLRVLAEKMVETRSLRADRSKFADGVNGEVLHDLLDSHVLVEWQSSPDEVPDRYTITFAHHVFFDFAIAQLLFGGSPTKLLDRLASETDLVIAIRPSISFHYQQVWKKDKKRKVFWEEVFSVMQSSTIPKIGKLIGPNVAVDLADSFSDLRPVVDKFENKDETQKTLALQVLRYLISTVITTVETTKANITGSRAGVWCDLAECLSRTMDQQTVYMVRGLTFNLSGLLDDLSPEQITQIGAAARRLLIYAWSQKPDVRDSSLVNHALQVVSRTCESDPGKTAVLLRQALEPKHLSEYGFEEIPTISREVEKLAKVIPDLVQELYISAFTFREMSDEKTSMGRSRIMPLSSNKRQDYDMARYELVQIFPEYTKQNPVQATIAMLSIIDYYSIQEGGAETTREQLFDFNGKVARFRPDQSAFWDHDYRHYDHEPPNLLQIYTLHLGSLSRDDSQKDLRRKIIDLIVEKNRAAAVWRRLLLAGAENPATLGMDIKSLAWSAPLLKGYDTSNPARRFIQAIYPHLSSQERKRIEKTIFSFLSTEVEQEKQYVEKLCNRLIDNIPFELLVTDEARVLAERLKSIHLIPSSESSLDNDEDEEFEWRVTDTTDQELNASDERSESVSNFIGTFRNSVPSMVEIEQVYPFIKELYNETKGSGNNSTWGKISEACEIISRQDSVNCDSEIGSTVRDILLDAAKLKINESETESPSEDQGDENIYYISTTRTHAASGIMLLTRIPTCINLSIISAVDHLSSDPNTYVRMEVAQHLHFLHKINPQLTWQIAEKLARKDQSLFVLSLLVGYTLLPLSRTAPDQVLDLVGIILNRVDREKVKELRNSHILILLTIYFWTNNSRAYESLYEMIRNSGEFQIEVSSLIFELRDWIRPNLSANEKVKKIISERALPLFKDVVHSLCRTIKLWEAAHSDSAKKIEAKELEYIQGLAQLADSAAMQIYFASGAYDEKEDVSKKDKRPPKLEEKMFFFERMASTIEEIGELGHPNIVEHLVKTLESLIPVDPQRIFLMVGTLVREGQKGGYQFESIAMGSIKRIIERYMADYRTLLQHNKECQKTLFEVLDIFVDSGWTDAHRLSNRLEEIFW